MRIDAIAVGADPPQDVNVIVEVPIGGEPIKYELDKAADTLVVDRFLHTPMGYPGKLWFRATHPVGRRRPDRRARGQHAPDRARSRHQRPAHRSAQDGG